MLTGVDSANLRAWGGEDARKASLRSIQRRGRQKSRHILADSRKHRKGLPFCRVCNDTKEAVYIASTTHMVNT